jgi:hypothetical protein
MSARRWLVLTAATVVVLIALSLIVVALRPAATFEPDTPEGTVQRYVSAVIERDLVAARALFAADLADACASAAFARRVQESFWWGGSSGREDWHVRLVERAPLAGDRVRVTVSVERTIVDPPFGVGGATTTHVFVVAREDDAWRIVSFDWPSPCF